MATRRRAIVTALAVAIAFVVPSMVLPATAHAAAYRYWSYWLGTAEGWSFANVGPSFRIPADGTLEGWRFSVSGVEGNHAPSMGPDFDAVCGATPAEDGRKRVAVVVDPGVPGDAPEGEQPPGAWALCVVAAPRATGYDVLRAAATVRAERGLICGIGGYPARGCADVIADPSPTPAPSSSATPKPTPKPTRSPKPSRSPEPSEAPAPTSSAPSSADASPANPATSDARTTAPGQSSETSPSTTPNAAAPGPSGSSPPPTPSTPSSVASSAAPSPTYSLLTAPLEQPPTDGGGPGAAIVAGIAVVGIAGLGGAAILRMRRGA